ncbi:MAG: hypothetical protein KIS66_16765 [Fimbriimonadaceae bacterium]|nr:hypothetical protein [Fimbriimonadaceae bacterium]
MATTWEQFKALVLEKARFDGATTVSLSATALGSEFDVRVMRHFRSFCRACREFYAYNAALTLATSDQEVDLYSSAKCAREVFLPTKVFLNKIEILRTNRDALEGIRQQAALTAGLPQYWVVLREGAIRFDVPVSATVAAYSNNYVAGYAEHPTISTDETAISLSESAHEAAALWCSILISKPSVDANLSIQRIAQYNEDAARFVLQRRADNTVGFGWEAVGGL